MQGDVTVVAKGLTAQQCRAVVGLCVAEAPPVARALERANREHIVRGVWCEWMDVPRGSASLVMTQAGTAVETDCGAVGVIVTRNSAGDGSFGSDGGALSSSTTWIWRDTNPIRGQVRVLASGLTDDQCAQVGAAQGRGRGAGEVGRRPARDAGPHAERRRDPAMVPAGPVRRRLRCALGRRGRRAGVAARVDQPGRDLRRASGRRRAVHGARALARPAPVRRDRGAGVAGRAVGRCAGPLPARLVHAARVPVAHPHGAGRDVLRRVTQACDDRPTRSSPRTAGRRWRCRTCSTRT